MNRPLLLTTAASALIGIYVFFIMPLSGKREEIKETLQAEYASMKKYEKFLQNIDGAKRQLDSASGRLRTLEQNIMREKDVSLASSRLQAKIQDMARSSGISIASLRPLPPSAHNGYTSLPIFIDGSGSIAALSNFLKTLDSPSALLSVDKLDVAAAPQDMLRIKIQISGLMRT